MGLAVVARYVRNMKGQIRVQSELGKGTIFGIELPFENATRPPTAAPPLPTPLDETPKATNFPATSSTYSEKRRSTLTSEHQHIGAMTLPDGTVLPSPDLQPPEGVTTGDERSAALSSESSTDPAMSTFPFPQIEDEPSRDRLSVLIAEDNPVNARVLTRRLLRLGHEVELALDGQQAHDHFTLTPHTIDVILMDLQVRLFPVPLTSYIDHDQMPLVDGASSAKMIRQHEKDLLEELRRDRPRVPIIAVSASLVEDKRLDYISSG